jgi:hypothetical protein
MSDMPETDDLLRAAGEVPPPEPRVLDEARESLWSAIAGEMLGCHGIGGTTGGSAGREAGRRRQPGRQENGHGMSMGGGERGDR